MKRAAVALSLAAALEAPEARAQLLEVFAPDRGRESFESPQNFAFELRGGPYYPVTDSEFGAGARRPIEEIFGTNDRLYLGVEFDWQLVRFNWVGSLGLGVAGGWASLSRPARVTSQSDTGETALGAETGQNTTLTVLPLAALAVVRLDGLARNTAVPVIPYLKLGVAYTVWWSSFGDGLSRLNEQSPTRTGEDPALFGRAAQGGSLGLQWAAGVMLRLDAFEPRAQRAWDANMGVNHSHLFIEWTQNDAGTLGSRPQLRLGWASWVVGVELEF
ncbi:MAG: hypothetical protein HY909_20300 [Deltaproteobacteria bacterium]|nr:hypothetical protein [Deltaproteobacteria bacterium]